MLWTLLATLAASSRPAAAAPSTPASRVIPKPWSVRFAWGDTARDPFLDGSRKGKDALLGNRPALALATAPLGYGIKDFLDDLSSASGAEFKVQGILPGGNGIPSVAVINNQSYAEGDLVPVRATTHDFESFAAIAKAKNIAFERATGASAATRGPGPTAPTPPTKAGQPATVDVVVLLQMGRVLPPDARGPGSIELRAPGYPDRVAFVPYHFVPRLSRSVNPVADGGRR